MIRAVLFDIGGPLDLETAFEAAIDAHIRAGLEREGFLFTEDEWRAANDHAVEVFAPNVYRAMIWRLTHGDAAACQRIYASMEAGSDQRRHLFELRPGIRELLETIVGSGLKLGLAANQPVSALDRLAEHGIGHVFGSQGIAGVVGYRKPDVRLFLRACDDLSVIPADCIMVGDRIDNDIVPAKLLGMKTVLLRTGRHARQQPRAWDEVPDRQADGVPGILEAIRELTSDASEVP